jgi:hypothetical protein
MQRLITQILSLALLLACLSGCSDAAYWQLRTFYGIDCRPEKLTNGQCTPVKKGDNVKTAQP